MHVISFLVWLVTLAIHAAAYVLQVPGLIAGDWPRAPGPPPCPQAAFDNLTHQAHLAA